MTMTLSNSGIEFPDETVQTTAKDYIIDTYINGTSWYRKWKSGWVEQGGYAAGVTNNSTQVANLTLLVGMANTNFNGQVTVATNDASSISTATTYFHPITTTTVAIGSGYAAGRPVYWECKGMGN